MSAGVIGKVERLVVRRDLQDVPWSYSQLGKLIVRRGLTGCQLEL